MPRKHKTVALDAIDRKIIEVLLVDARISIRELANQVKLSPPSVSERIERLQERGIIRRFTIDLIRQASDTNSRPSFA